VAASVVSDDPRAGGGRRRGLGVRMGRWLQASRKDEGDEGNVLSYDDLVLNRTTREVTRGGRQIDLTPIEFDLLELLLANPHRVLTRSEILSSVWGFDFGSMSNTLNVYIGYVRRKTEAEGEPRLIHTVRGVGYVLRDKTRS
jgi:two-component system, OmpR family, response regulator MprA